MNVSVPEVSFWVLAGKADTMGDTVTLLTPWHTLFDHIHFGHFFSHDRKKINNAFPHESGEDVSRITPSLMADRQSGRKP